ncbi:MAG TPA: M36 family metallopeptidase, partial [Actinomycetota bacterium]
MHHRRSRHAAAIGLLTAFVLVFPPLSSAVGNIEEIHHGLPAIDTRTEVVEPTAAQLELVRGLGAEAVWNRYGTPQSLIRHGGYLGTGVEGATAAEAARAWLDANRALFKLGSTDGLEVTAEAPLGDAGSYAVVFQQYVDGLPVADGFLSVGLAKRGAGWSVAFASSTVTGDEDVETVAALSVVEGWAAAADAVGADASIADIKGSSRDAGWTTFRVSTLKGTQEGRRVAFATPKRGVRAAVETIVSDESGGSVSSYRQIVDAATGQILFRESTVDQAIDNPKWLVWEANPHTALDEYPWNYPSADSRELWCWLPDPACQFIPSTSNGDNDTEWDRDGRPGSPPSFTTIGNNANSSEAWFNAGGPGPTGFRPTSPTRDYVYPFTNVWFETQCSPSNFVPGVGNDISAATANLFAMHNRMHDWSYVLGFTETTWNAQSFNFGKNTPGENDPVLGQAQAGAVNGGYPNYAGRDNANMNTQRDGRSSITNMYLWQPLAGTFYAPCVDGDYDMSVIGHEYGHMIENRMIGKSFRRQGNHAGMMGESNGDLLAMEYLNEYNLVPAGGGDNPTHDAATSIVGRYATGNDDRGIRNYDMAFPTAGEFPVPGKYSHVNPLNLSALGYDITGPQVHADGEIWSATNFDLRELLLNRYPSNGTRIQRECADGYVPPEACP